MKGNRVEEDDDAKLIMLPTCPYIGVANSYTRIHGRSVNSSVAISYLASTPSKGVLAGSLIKQLNFIRT